LNKGFTSTGGGFKDGTPPDSSSPLANAAWQRYITGSECEQYLPKPIVCPDPFDPQDPTNWTTVEGDPGLRVADFDGDGREDILSFAAPEFSSTNFLALTPFYDPKGIYQTYSVQIIPGTNEGLGSPILVATDTNQAPTNGAPAVRAGGNTTGDGQPPHAFNRVLDVNGDGLPDFVSNQDREHAYVTDIHLYIHEGKKPDVLLSVTNGLGATDSVEYDHLGDRDSDTFIPGTCTYPQYCVRKGVWVVAKLHRDTGGALGGAATADFKYQYDDARTDVQGLGWLGFRHIQVTNQVTGEVTETFNEDAFKRATVNGVSSYPEAFLPTVLRHTSFLDGGVVLQETREDHYNVGSSGEVLLASSTETQREGDVNFTAVKTQRTLVRSLYDAQGNPLHETEELDQADDPQSALRTISLRTTDRTYDNDLVSWLLGLKRTERTEVQTLGEDAEDIVRNGSWDFVPGTNLVAHEVREPGGAADITRTMTYGRNARGLVTRITEQDALGNTRTSDIGYDAVVGHFPETITRAGLTVIQRRHPSLGVVARQSDPNGVGTTFVYDTFGRRKNALPDLAGATTWTYSAVADGTAASAIDESTQGAPARRTLVDRLGRTHIVEQHLLGDLDGFAGVQTDYDPAGRIARVSLPFATGLLPTLADWEFTHFTYDGANRLATITYPAEKIDVITQTDPSLGVTAAPRPSGEVVRTHNWLSTTSYHLDKVGDPVAQMIQTVTVDAAGRITSTASTDPVTGHVASTAFGYGATHLRRVTDAAGNVTSMTYDPWGRRTVMTDPDTGTTQTSYNAFDDVIQDITPRGTTIHFRDDLGRWTGDTGPDGVTTLTWDVAQIGLGSPGTATSADGVQMDWAYDTAGRLQITKWTIPGESSPFTLEEDRDAFGRLGTVGYPASGSYNLQAVYGYSPTGYLASVVRQEDANPPATLWTADSRAVDGQVAHETFGDGTDAIQSETTRIYTFTGKLSSLITSVGGSSAGLQNTTYDYDGLGRLKSRDADKFQYDFVGRLRSWDHANASWTETYEYDDIGNLNRFSGGGRAGVEIDELFHFGDNGAGPHAITSGPDGTYTYDEVGNQKTAPGRIATFWEFGLPKQVTTNGTQTTFMYDALHARVVKANNQGSRTVSLGGLYEKRVDNQQTSYVFYVPADGRVVAQLNVDAVGHRHTLELHADHLGSPVLITDESGVPSTVEFDPWGKKITFDSNGHPVGATMSVPSVRVGFTGRDQDDDLGLVNMNGRLYDPRQRRFISPDPFVHHLFNGQALNRYAYVLNDPLNHVDPSGFDDAAAGGGEESPAASPPSPARSRGSWDVEPATDGHGHITKRGIPLPRPGKQGHVAPGNHSGGHHGGGDSSAGARGSTQAPAESGATVDSSGTSAHAPNTGQNTNDVPNPGKNGDGHSSYVAAGASPNGSLSPKAIPNGADNSDAGWFAAGMAAAGVTMNADTRKAIEGAVIAMPLITMLAPLVEGLLAVDEALIATETFAPGGPGLTVLGNAPDYLDLAAARGANALDIPASLWDALTEEERVAVLEDFVDAAIARGDTIILATPPSMARAGSYFQTVEVPRLQSRGFVPNADGTAMIRAGR
jgi:RHS repeat-associated protein